MSANPTNIPGVPATPSPINYEQALLTAGVASQAGSSVVGGSVPVDSDGTINIWNLPKYLVGPNAPKLWFDTGHEVVSSPHPSMGEHSGGGIQIDNPQSFDINRSATDIMKQFAAMSQTDPAKFQAVQKELADSGFYGSTTTIYGGWNKQTEDALANAMTQYLKVSHSADVPVSFVSFLQNTAQANAANGNGLGGAASTPNIPAGPSLSDPNALAVTVQSAAQNALGRNLSPDELTKFVSAFHGDETSAFDTAQAGGQPYTQPNAQASADAFVKNGHQGEMNQHQVQGYADAFLNMFLSGGSAAPNVNIDEASTGV